MLPIERIIICNKLHQIREKFYGIDKGLKFLDSFMPEIKKSKIDLQNDKIKIYDHLTGEVFCSKMSNSDLNFFFQNFYLDFVYQEFSENYEYSNLVLKNLLDRLIPKEIQVKSPEISVVFSSIIKMSFFILKKINDRFFMLSQVKIKMSQFLAEFESRFDQDKNLYLDTAKNIFDLFLDLGLLEKDFFDYKIKDSEFFFGIKSLYYQIADVFNSSEFKIDYSSFLCWKI